MGYPCEGWVSLNCTETVRALPWVFDAEDQDELLRHCPVACKACDPDAAPTSTTTTTTTTTAAAVEFPVDVRFSAPAGPPHLEEYIPEVGDAVVRGPGWSSGTADGGAGCVGTVVAVEPGPTAPPRRTPAGRSCPRRVRASPGPRRARTTPPWARRCDAGAGGAVARRTAAFPVRSWTSRPGPPPWNGRAASLARTT